MSRIHLYLVLAGILLASCSSSRIISDPDFMPSSVPSEQIAAAIPDYTGELTSAKGSGRALVSEPGNSERITIEFESDSVLSLLTIKNRIGIEGGQMLVDKDSILIYNKIDKYAQKVSVTDGRLTSLNELASVNLLDLLNYKLNSGVEKQVFESQTHFMLRLKNDGQILVSKADSLITEVSVPRNTGLPYSKILYESYGQVQSYTLPRKITIFSADGSSKVLLQVRDLTVNTQDLNLSLEIPEDIPVRRL